jgi:GT2 family glycosyltransferase
VDRVAVVILTYDAPEGLLEAAVDAVATSCEGALPVVDVVVVDNGIGAGSRLGDRARVLRPGSNGGYAAGMNAGIRWAATRGADAVALLNDDVVVVPGWLDPLVAALDADPTVGAAQPTLLSGWHEGASVLDLDGAVVDGTGVVVDRFGAGSDRDRGRPWSEVGDAVDEIEAFTGGAVLIRRSAVDEVGGFDERFFLYYEDVELSRRMRRSGWRLVHVPASVVWHVGSASTASLGDDRRRLQERNRLWSSAMHGSARELGAGLWLSVRRLRHPPRRAHARALAAGVAGVPSRVVRRLLARPGDHR